MRSTVRPAVHRFSTSCTIITIGIIFLLCIQVCTWMLLKSEITDVWNHSTFVYANRRKVAENEMIRTANTAIDDDHVQHLLSSNTKNGNSLDSWNWNDGKVTYDTKNVVSPPIHSNKVIDEHLKQNKQHVSSASSFQLTENTHKTDKATETNNIMHHHDKEMQTDKMVKSDRRQQVDNTMQNEKQTSHEQATETDETRNMDKTMKTDKSDCVGTTTCDVSKLSLNVKRTNDQIDVSKWISALKIGTPLAAFQFLLDALERPSMSTAILRASQPLRPEEWLALIRVQKTASKTVTEVLEWMMQDMHRRWRNNVATPDCDGTFSTSTVPTVLELQNKKSMYTMENVYDIRGRFAAEAAQHKLNYWEFASSTVAQQEHLIHNVWFEHLHTKGIPLKGLESSMISHKPSTLVPTFDEQQTDVWYKGAPLREYLSHWPVGNPQLPPKGCSANELPHVSVQCSSSFHLLQSQHMHIYDVYGSLWETLGVPPSMVQLIITLRHPVRRVASEIKHVYHRTRFPVWDYCLNSKFDRFYGKYPRSVLPNSEPVQAIHNRPHTAMVQSSRSKVVHGRQLSSESRLRGRQPHPKHSIADPTNNKNNFVEFMLNPQHAFGMRNRQTKMISGLVVEPYIPSLDQVDSLLKQHDFEMYDKQNDENSNIPSNRFSNPSSVDHTHGFKQYSKWARAAVNQAKFVLLNSTGIMVTERMVESLAVLFVSFDWRPPIQFENNKYFPASSISSDPFLSKSIHELKGLAQAKPLNSKAQSGLSANQKQTRPGTPLRQAVQLTWSKLELNDVSAKVHAKNSQMDNRASVESLRPLFSHNGPDSIAWDRLLILCDAIVTQFTIREKTDKSRLSFNIGPELREAIRAVNHLDVELFSWTDALLSARVHRVRQQLATL